MVDYCVIQFPKRQVVAGSIDRQLRAGCGDHLERIDVPNQARVSSNSQNGFA